MIKVPARSDLPRYVLLALASALTLAFFHYFAEQRGDDAFIFYRIADHLRAGHGPVFNAGEHVEAYSSPSWLVLLTLARALVDYISAARWLGYASTLATLAGTYRLARLLGGTANYAAGAVLASCLGGSLYYWTPSGLETTYYAALFTWCCVATLRGPWWCWALLVGVLGVSRPEGMFLSVIGVGVALMGRPRRPTWLQCLAALALPLLYLIFRLGYFGYPFPNTYYAKATGALGRRLLLGIDYALWPLLAAVALLPTLLGAVRRREWPTLAVSALAAALIAAVIVGGGDWMWGRRLLLPCIPVLLALGAVQFSRARRVGPGLFAAFALGLHCDDLPWPDRKDYPEVFGLESLPTMAARPGHALDLRVGRPVRTLLAALSGERMPAGSRIEGTMTEASADVAEFLRQNYPKDTLMAVNHAGAVPYYAGLPTLDMTGLADEHIAHLRGERGLHEKYDVDYVFSRQPGVLVLNSRVRPTAEKWYVDGYWQGETALVNHPDFSRFYRPVPRFWSWHYADGFTSYILVYERIR